ncbi:hypothetical protein OCU04_008524 [Sclerotinia nivalis]|uniref:Fe2OG dioxygenase domain-containing protein n=1 Tax=Sclerotinia nivalis TaxID=352851 RepID=A0A9X0AJ44_9HELO|nr:hypothetical protein OCU04_008524 [Sclerotinia nivalis]
MTIQTRTKEALRIAGDFNVQDFYPAPFPEDVPTIELKKISLSKLLDGDEAEAQLVFESCTTTSFFYLDMLDHAIGRQIWRSACNLCQLGRDRFSATPLEEKLKYQVLPGTRVFDRGYLFRSSGQGGMPDELEVLNVPQSEFFGTKVAGGGLPSWLAQDENTFRQALQCGNIIARAILSVLEKKLELPNETFTKLHRLNDDSGDFIRTLRYLGIPSVQQSTADGFPAHKDATSITILFTWLGGLQTTAANAEIEGFNVKNEDWRWIRPEPGYAIVNLGDAMEIFTNNVLKSGMHRVVKAPGQQRPHDRMSVIIATRPENKSLMKAFDSPLIPHREQDGKVMTSLEWGHNVVVEIQKRAQAQAEAVSKSVDGNLFETT